ncbi:MAG: ribosome biogenesis GTP-binding protein YihA/YsxC [Burkholderiaceae bacterium]
MELLASARFRETIVASRQLESANPAALPEIAFVGRSNAGKSTCINLLCGRRRLAFASRTPGRTQALNLFALGPEDDERGFLVDTPGYGYAAAPQASKGVWQALAGDYLRNRTCLRAVVMIIDIRRELTVLDRQLLSWAPDRLPVAAVLTKSDKLGRMQVAEACRRVARDPALAGRGAPTEVIAFSALSRTGIVELQHWITGQLAPSGTSVAAPSVPVATDDDRVAAAAEPVRPERERR